MTLTDESHLQAALDANPDDHHTRVVFADWLEERDDIRAEGYRALGMWKRRPQLTELVDRPRWSWSWVSWAGWFKDDYQQHLQCLPWDWFDDSRRDCDHRLAHWPTRREADDAAALAFRRLPSKQQSELLAGKDGAV